MLLGGSSVQEIRSRRQHDDGNTPTRIYLRPVAAAEQRTVRALGARWDRVPALWWVDDTWPDLRRFDRWLPPATLAADVARNIERILGQP